MLDAQGSFGPEAACIRQDGAVALGSRLYRLLPEDRVDGATASGPGGTVVVGDIRIDNRPFLFERLGISLAEGVGYTDTGLLALGWDRLGANMLRDLTGDYAVAIWEPISRRLLLARDPASQRPLHYFQGPGIFAFASMPAGLHALPVTRRPDLEAVAEFLAMLPENSGRSFYEGIETVPPGSLLSFSGRLTSETLWQPNLELIRWRDSRDYAEALRERFDRAVASRLRGAGKTIACHLSSGFDSSAVTAAAASLLKASGGQVMALTSVPASGFPGRIGSRITDEGGLAAATAAKHHNIHQKLVRSSYAAPLANVGRHTALYQRPMLNPLNMVWLDDIKDAVAQQGARILLTGARGNLSLSYTGYPLLNRLFKQLRWLPLIREILALRRNGVSPRTSLSQAFGPSLPSPLWRLIASVAGGPSIAKNVFGVSAQAWRRWHIDEKAQQRGVDYGYRPGGDSQSLRMRLLSTTDYGNYNKGTLAGWGIDTRDPTSDRELIELCLRIPDEQFLRDGTPRSIYKLAMGDLLPEQLLANTLKGQQAADWFMTFSDSRYELQSTLSSLSTISQVQETLDLPRLSSLIAKWPTQDWDKQEHSRDYRLSLLRCLAAGQFIAHAACPTTP
jgi:asparagine synthase (glutamine-hydrolysing)